jgi:hypothetical protein
MLEGVDGRPASSSGKLGLLVAHAARLSAASFAFRLLSLLH